MTYQRDEARLEKTLQVLEDLGPIKAPVFRVIMTNLYYTFYPEGCNPSGVFDGDMAALVDKGNVINRSAGTSEIYEVVG